jgi:hypothetical protein
MIDFPPNIIVDSEFIKVSVIGEYILNIFIKLPGIGE